MVRYNSALCGFIYFILYSEIILPAKSSNTTSQGPYISNLVRAEKCKNPSMPYQKEFSIDVTVEMFSKNNKTYLRGNYTACKPDPNLKLTVQDYTLMNGDWKQMFHISGMSCRGRIVAMMGQIFGIKFNKKTCTVPKGVYSCNNIEFDFVDHVFSMKRVYGRALRKVIVTSKMETALCFDFESVVSELQA